MSISIQNKLDELYLIIARDQFHFLKFILEGYDSLCTLSSIDMNRGVVRIRYARESRNDIFKLLETLASRINSLETSKLL